MSRVLVAIDGSDPAEEALSFALDQHAADDLVAITAIDPSSFVQGSPEFVTPDVEAWQSRAEDEANAVLEAAVDRAAAHDIDLETEVVYGAPARAIVEYAEEAAVDHIVVGCHGRDGVARVLLGSVAETVVRRSPVPVTVVR